MQCAGLGVQGLGFEVPLTPNFKSRCQDHREARVPVATSYTSGFCLLL